MRVWSTLRPISIGTYPKEYGVIEIVNFDHRRMVPEINRQAFGYIDYERDLPKEVQSHYDLWPEVTVDPRLEPVAKLFARALQEGDMSRITKIVDKAYEKGLIEDEEELVKAAQAYM